MNEDVTICIGTFGDEKWIDLAKERAIPSAEAQTVKVNVIHNHHSSSLSVARTHAAAKASSEYLIFLDADDELDPHYVEEMLKGTADLRQPATLGIVNGVEDDFPVVIATKPLLRANYLVIGTMCRRDMFFRVGGFFDLPVLEDWDLWIRMYLDGATIEAIPDAIYRVHVNPNSRNQNQYLHNQIYNWIQTRYHPIARQKGML